MCNQINYKNLQTDSKWALCCFSVNSLLYLNVLGFDQEKKILKNYKEGFFSKCFLSIDSFTESLKCILIEVCELFILLLQSLSNTTFHEIITFRITDQEDSILQSFLAQQWKMKTSIKIMLLNFTNLLQIIKGYQQQV